ncbi:DUF6244 family protein [Micromonospora sp. S-DT3-3-22]|uniref:DUF6244 family protein n=1 Tax=Micromonospora sp. S-DT3-3-22 TaxID=2755359 RepID=UPI00188FE58F|nr:DUF6244 family protein [Micromonospora sp. S-DT3-3-22]
MSLIDGIIGDLKAMAAGVASTEQHVRAVNDAVEQIAVRAAAAGFTAVAAGLTPARGVLGQVQAQLTSIGGVLGETARVVAAVPQQSSPQEVTAVLASVAAALTVVDNGIAASTAQIGQARQYVVGALRGGQPGPTLAGLQRVNDLLHVLRTRGEAARHAVNAALTQARHVGALDAPAAGGGNASATQPVPVSPVHSTGPPPGQGSASDGGQNTFPAPVDPAWRQVDPGALPDTVRATAGSLPPRPSGSTRPTQGFLDSMPVTSGGGDRSLAADLVHDPLRGPPVTFYDHVESKAAAHLRRAGGGAADLAIDNTVCGTNDRDQAYPWTCDKILPAILPAGSRLRVWVTRDGGTTWWHRVYTGTGERISR